MKAQRIERNRTSLVGARTLTAGLAVTLLLATGCTNRGGDVSTSGGTGAGAGPPLAIDFGLRRDLFFGNGLVGDTTTADLNLDGLTDLIEADFSSQTVAIAQGNPDGTFSRIALLPAVGHAWRVVPADLDGDGLLDVAVAATDYLGTGVSAVEAFLQGPSVGEFGTRQAALVLDANPKDVAAAPMSGMKGDPGPDDLFLTLRDSAAVVQVRLVGDTFQEVERMDSSALGALGRPYSAAVVDIGGDGLLDLVVGEVDVDGGLPDRVIAYPRGSGGFGDPILVLDGADWPLVDAIGDVDGNGFDDVAVAQIQSEDTYLLAGSGAGLDTAHALTFDGVTSSLIFSDVNGDGLADAIGTVVERNAIEVHLATGPFQWGDPTYYQSGFLPRAIATLKLPGDDVPDLLCANNDDTSILYGLGQGLFRGAVGFPTLTDGPVAVRTADLDQDGNVDAVAIAAFQQAVSFMQGQSDGTLKTVTTVPLVPTTDEEPGYLVIRDFDGDGLDDVAISLHEPNQVRLLRNNGTVDGFDEAEPGDIYQVGNEPAGLSAGDVNGDGLPDIVVGNLMDDTVQVLLNTGNGEFQVQPPVSIDAQPAVVELVDLDNDGILDLVVTTGTPGLANSSATFEPGSLVVLAGDGSGGFTVESVLPVDSTSTSIALADVDGDGFTDVAVAPTGNAYDSIMLFRNHGGFVLQREDVFVGPDPANVVIADADNDGNLDLIVPSGFGELNVVLGDGSGGFGEIFPNETGALPVLRDTVSVDYADLTRDGLPELVFVAAHSPFVWVGLNTSVELPQN